LHPKIAPRSDKKPDFFTRCVVAKVLVLLLECDSIVK
jgi:hypothetical protein